MEGPHNLTMYSDGPTSHDHTLLESEGTDVWVSYA